MAESCGSMQGVPMNVLVAGGAGYIGSHAVKQLLDAGHRVAVVDNLCRGHARRSIAGPPSTRSIWPTPQALADVLRRHAVDCVMHFAALAYVGESVTDPLGLLRQQYGRHVSLLKAMQRRGRQAAGVQFDLRHLRRARSDADRGDHAQRAAESVRLVEVVRRAGAAGLRGRRSGVSPSPPCDISTWPARLPTARWAKITIRKRT